MCCRIQRTQSNFKRHSGCTVCSFMECRKQLPIIFSVQLRLGADGIFVTLKIGLIITFDNNKYSSIHNK